MSLTRSKVRVLRKVDAGFCHALGPSRLTMLQRELAEDLEREGLLRLLPPKGRFPTRFVLTASGSHATGTFDFAD